MNLTSEVSSHYNRGSDILEEAVYEIIYQPHLLFLLAFQGEGEKIEERGIAPLLLTFPFPLYYREEGRGDRLINNLKVDSLTIYRRYVILCLRNRRWDFGDASPSPQGRFF